MSASILISREPVLNRSRAITATRLTMQAPDGSGACALIAAELNRLAEVWPASRTMFVGLGGVAPDAGLLDWQVPQNAMIEIPAAALALGVFLAKLDFLSIGTNDLIQYTLAIDRTDEAVAHLYDPLHPAVLRLIAHTIQAGKRAGLPVAVCGEMAGDPTLTRLLLGMGLRQFSMHPAQILEVKQEVLGSNLADLRRKVGRLLNTDDPARLRQQLERLNAI